jgi:flagellar biosynthesis protein FlhF
MLIRKYRARRLTDALAQVKADLGEHATIITTRTVRKGLWSSDLEVAAGIEGIGIPGAASGSRASTAVEATAGLGGADSSSAQGPHSAARSSPTEASLTAELQALRRELLRIGRHGRADAAANADLRRQIVGLSEEVRRLQQQVATSTRGAEPSAISTLRTRLQRSGLEPTSVEQLLATVAIGLPPDPQEAQACVATLVTAAIEQSLSYADPIESGCWGTIALVGPAGAGKTTALAKIATRAALVHDRRVAIVGCSTTHAASGCSLPLLAEAIGAPFRLATRPKELADAISALSDADLILVDTSASAAEDAHELGLLAAVLCASGAETHLVLNAELRHEELRLAVERFASLRPQSLLITRIDEAESPSCIYDAARVSGLPLMYLMAGRRVPHDIEPATALGVVSLIMGHEVN